MLWLVPFGMFPLKQTEMARALCSRSNKLVSITGALACSHWPVPFQALSDGSGSLQKQKSSSHQLVLARSHRFISIGLFPSQQPVMAQALCARQQARDHHDAVGVFPLFGSLPLACSHLACSHWLVSFMVVRWMCWVVMGVVMAVKSMAVLVAVG